MVIEKSLQDIYLEVAASYGKVREVDGIPIEWGGDKGTTHSYLEHYAELLKPYRNKEVSLLEIGVQYGASLKSWKKYFKKGIITGLDIKPHCTKYEEDRIRVNIVDACNEELVDETFGDETFDIIIDDGSHQLPDQLKAFEILFSRLTKGGIYIIEDIQDLDSQQEHFEKLHESCEVIDIRHTKHKYDDVLVVYRKGN
tara:strand:- start:1042 stop:1635 length:594 start_codon:yes stop_codon:yes gene_type:complete